LNIPEYIESRAAEDGIPETDNLDRLNKLIKFGISRIPNEIGRWLLGVPLFNCSY